MLAKDSYLLAGGLMLSTCNLVQLNGHLCKIARDCSRQNGGSLDAIK
jgi:hypothetical protein